jgi:hypothetical protein
MKNSTNLIYYPGGCYGTFIEWSCYYFSNFNLDLPFTDNGSSHKYFGNFLHPPEVLFDYVQSNKKEKFARAHPGLFQHKDSHESGWPDEFYNIAVQDLLYAQEHFNKILVVHPSLDTLLWLENNILEKAVVSAEFFNHWYGPHGYKKEIYKDLIDDYSIEQRIKHVLHRELDTDDIKNWGKDSVYDLSTWELRELLSLYWFNRHDDFLTCWDQLANRFPTIKFISLKSLKNNSLGVMKDYLQFFNLRIGDTADNNVIKSWKKSQFHINKDDIVKTIVSSILYNIPYNWEDQNLTFIDEAYIQKLLLDNNVAIKCFELDTLPTNTKDFVSIIA